MQRMPQTHWTMEMHTQHHQKGLSDREEGTKIRHQSSRMAVFSSGRTAE